MHELFILLFSHKEKPNVNRNFIFNCFHKKLGPLPTGRFATLSGMRGVLDIIGCWEGKYVENLVLCLQSLGLAIRIERVS